MTLIKSISGIRGTIVGGAGEGLNPLDIVKFTSAYATLIRKTCTVKSNKIVVGRDARISGEMVKNVVVGTLMGMGWDVVDIDLASTPTTELAVTCLLYTSGKSSCFSNGCRKEDRCAYRRKRQSGYAWISRKWYNLRQPIGESPDAGGSNAEKGHGTNAAYPASYRHMPTKNDGCLPYNGQRDNLSRYKKQSPAREHWT